MKKILKWFGVAAVYIGVALVVILIMQYFYLSSDFFRSLFEGGTLQAAPAAEGASGTAPGTGSNLTETTAKLSFYIRHAASVVCLYHGSVGLPEPCQEPGAL